MDSDGPFIVFGANGFLGSEIVLQLRRRNRWSVIVAPVTSIDPQHINPRIANANVKLMLVSSVATESELEACVTATDYQSTTGRVGIFHAAGLSTFCDNEKSLQSIHVCNTLLTNQIFSFCASRRIRTVYASCAAVVGCQFLDLADWVAHDDSHRCRSSIEPFRFLTQKRDLELHWVDEALKGRAPIIFLRPSTLLGPGDEKLRSTRCLMDVLTGLGPFPAKYRGGISFCDVRDVGAAFVRAMLSAAVDPGCVMNLTAANLPYDDFVVLVEDTLRISASSLVPYRYMPRIPSPAISVIRQLLRLREWLRWADVSNEQSDDSMRLTPAALEYRRRYFNVTCQRAKTLLDWDPRDIEETIQDTARYLVRTVGAQNPGDGVRVGSNRFGKRRVDALRPSVERHSLSWLAAATAASKKRLWLIAVVAMLALASLFWISL